MSFHLSDSGEATGVCQLRLILLAFTNKQNNVSYKTNISLFLTLYCRKYTLFQFWCFMYQNIIIIISWCLADLSKLNESQSPHFLLTAQLKVKVHGRKRCLEVRFFLIRTFQRGRALLNKLQYFWNKTRLKIYRTAARCISGACFRATGPAQPSGPPCCRVKCEANTC